MESSRIVWEILARRGARTATTSEIRTLAQKAHMEPAHVVRHLRRGGRLVPLFRGLYYVPSPEEVELGALEPGHLKLFAIAAAARGMRRWYFGLGTALRHHGLTHEFTLDEFVINGDLYRIRGVPIGGRRFVILRWSPRLLGFGLDRLKGFAMSDPEKTVLDLAYRDLWSARRSNSSSGAWRDYIGSVRPTVIRRYLPRYPVEVGEEVARWI